MNKEKILEMKATKIKCVVDVDDSVIIPIDKIVFIDKKTKCVFVEGGCRYKLSDEQFNALMRELELIGGKFTD